ncbi:A-kinase anchor protein 10, mitochondrial isoform X2 [Hydra vulgaris]|uniref:A-kinase anchor protein 10, mitochondrial isoform X2 n=1 Tax=Hydra vulgaris TaxID=6087 RepID=UPI0032EA4816
MNKNETKKNRWSFVKKKVPIQYKDETFTFDLKELLEEKGICLKPRLSSSKSSRLSPSLLDVLKKSVALGYFLDFLNEHGKKNLLDFWLEAETFRMVLESQYKRSQRDALKKSSIGLKKEINYDSKTEEILDHRKCYEIDAIKKSSVGLKKEISFDIKTEEIMDHMRCCEKELTEENKSNNDACLNNFINENTEIAYKIQSSRNHDFHHSDSLKTENQDFRMRTRSCIVDAVSIYNKYISLNADNYIYLPQQCRQNIEAAVCEYNNYLEPSCFVNAQEFIFEQLLSSYDEFVLTTNMIAYQLRFLQERKLHLKDVLYNDSILFYFTEYLDQYGGRSTLEFYFTAEHFEDDVNEKLSNFTYNKNEVINDAIFLYERYFSMKCKQQLIKDDKLRIVLENNICREEGPQSNCFCIPMAYAWTALSDVYLPMFLQSANYKKYFDHLTNSLQNYDLKSFSSLSSLSTDESLTTSSDSKNNLACENVIDFGLKPCHHGRLALGHINEFGLFSSAMEPSFYEEKTSVSKFGKVVRNLLRGEAKEETEQLALERAKMIILEIQKQTKDNQGDISHSL